MANTPTYRIEAKTTAGIIDALTWKASYGAANAANLAKLAAAIDAQGGAPITRAALVRQVGGEVVAEYRAKK